jgi:hypothetical protein
MTTNILSRYGAVFTTTVRHSTDRVYKCLYCGNLWRGDWVGKIKGDEEKKNVRQCSNCPGMAEDITDTDSKLAKEFLRFLKNI